MPSPLGIGIRAAECPSPQRSAADFTLEPRHVPMSSRLLSPHSEGLQKLIPAWRALRTESSKSGTRKRFASGARRNEIKICIDRWIGHPPAGL